MVELAILDFLVLGSLFFGGGAIIEPYHARPKHKRQRQNAVLIMVDWCWREIFWNSRRFRASLRAFAIRSAFRFDAAFSVKEDCLFSELHNTWSCRNSPYKHCYHAVFFSKKHSPKELTKTESWKKNPLSRPRPQCIFSTSSSAPAAIGFQGSG